MFSGGTVVTIHGTNLDSVAEPRINLTVVTTTFYPPSPQTNSSTDDSDGVSICKLLSLV